MAPILKFVKHVCLHFDSRFPENRLADWNIFEFASLSSAASFNFGNIRRGNLIIKNQHFFEASEETCKTSLHNCQF